MRPSAVLLGVLLILPPADARGQTSSDFALELRAGVSLGADDLGHTSTIDAGGYLGVNGFGSAPLVGAGLIFPSVWLGIRPVADVTYAFPADAPTSWTPCPPGAACPSILIEPAASARWVDATAGVEIPIYSPTPSVRFFGLAGAGVRWYGFSWDQWGGDGTFLLPEGSHWESDFVLKLGLGTSFTQGAWEFALSLDGGWSQFGPGSVPIGSGSLPLGEPIPQVDMGRETVGVTTLGLGVRRALR